MSSDGGFCKMQSRNNSLKRHIKISQWAYYSGEMKMIFVPLKITLNAPNKKVITKLYITGDNSVLKIS